MYHYHILHNIFTTPESRLNVTSHFCKLKRKADIIAYNFAMLAYQETDNISWLKDQRYYLIGEDRFIQVIECSEEICERCEEIDLIKIDYSNNLKKFLGENHVHAIQI